jgi:hypothetical protein
MNRALAVALLVCTGAAIVAETMALVCADRVLALVTAKPDEIRPGMFHRVLALLSVFYVGELGLLLFMGDPVFRIYAFALVTMGSALWLARKYVVRWRVVVMLESTVCLVLLVDVAYTVLKTQRWLPF